MNNWERELDLIESLGKLYPEFSESIPEYKDWRYYHKAWWVCYLCTIHLKCRISSLENFIKENSPWAWDKYKFYFGIK